MSKIAYRGLAGFMTLWLSGVLFLLCCHLQNGYAAERDSCPLVKLSAHCEKGGKAKATDILTGQSNDQGMDCCAFIPAFFDKTRTNDSNQQVTVAVPPAVRASSIAVITRHNDTAHSNYHSPPILKNDTFLKNRTFRI